ncbi:MAG: hypothetical protein WCF06_08435, partial [Nitrososphaeraceae archaeon]
MKSFSNLWERYCLTLEERRAILVYIGDKLGLYKAMYNFAKPITSQELANLTSTSERYIREWLANQAAGGYLTYDPSSQRY